MIKLRFQACCTLGPSHDTVLVLCIECLNCDGYLVQNFIVFLVSCHSIIAFLFKLLTCIILYIAFLFHCFLKVENDSSDTAENLVKFTAEFEER